MIGYIIILVYYQLHMTIIMFRVWDICDQCVECKDLMTMQLSQLKLKMKTPQLLCVLGMSAMAW